MPIKFEYLEDSNILDLRVTGVLKSEEITEYFQKLLDGNFLKKDFIEIVDLNSATDFVLRYSDLTIIADQTTQLNKIGQKATMMCVYNQNSKGISAMMTPLYQRADFTFFLCDTENDLKTIMESLE